MKNEKKLISLLSRKYGRIFIINFLFNAHPHSYKAHLFQILLCVVPLAVQKNNGGGVMLGWWLVVDHIVSEVQWMNECDVCTKSIFIPSRARSDMDIRSNTKDKMMMSDYGRIVHMHNNTCLCVYI